MKEIARVCCWLSRATGPFKPTSSLSYGHCRWLALIVAIAIQEAYPMSCAGSTPKRRRVELGVSEEMWVGARLCENRTHRKLEFRVTDRPVCCRSHEAGLFPNTHLTWEGRRTGCMPSAWTLRRYWIHLSFSFCFVAVLLIKCYVTLRCWIESTVRRVLIDSLYAQNNRLLTNQIHFIRTYRH